MIFTIHYSQLPCNTTILDAGLYYVAMIDDVPHQIVFKQREAMEALSALGKRVAGPYKRSYAKRLTSNL